MKKYYLISLCVAAVLGFLLVGGWTLYEVGNRLTWETAIIPLGFALGGAVVGMFAVSAVFLAGLLIRWLVNTFGPVIVATAAAVLFVILAMSQYS